MTSERPVIVVVGPPLAGVSAVVAALRSRLPGALIFDAASDAPPRSPDAVVAVVSAVAPVAESEWALVERVATGAGLLVAAVSKVDAHLGWRDVLAVDRAQVAGWHPRRAALPWHGVAAAPDLGPVHVDELVEVLRDGLDGSRRRQRPALPTQASARADAGELRRVLARSRLHLLRFVRERTAEFRTGLRDAASAVTVGGAADFEDQTTAAARRLHVEMGAEITRTLAAAANELGLDPAATPLAPVGTDPPPVVDRTPSSSRRLEGRLMTVLGVGFGLGIALAVSRLLGGLAPGWSAAAAVAGAVAGLALVVWVVRTRGLLHDRALLDRWVGEVAAALRWHGEAMVAERLLAAESHWFSARAAGQSAPTAEPTLGRSASTRIEVTDQYEWC